MNRIQNFFLAALALIAFSSFSQTNTTDSLDLKIGQMIMVGIGDRVSVNVSDSLLADIRQNLVGGIILFEKNISPLDSRNTLKTMIKTMKDQSAIPLLVSIDEEGGKVHRLKPKYGFVDMPSAAYLGKLDNADSTLYYNRGLARELKSLGINFNYAPSVDLAINPENTVIVKRERSFSGSTETVTKHALICIKAHHEMGIKTILKHFPGHGSSTGDSHFGIVDVTDTWDFKELLPFYNIMKSGTCDAIMTAHIINRNWDTTYLPATLSSQMVNGVLRNLMGFRGVVFSDDMQMHAISKNYGFEKSLELAINAGVDILVYGNNVSKKDKPVSAGEVHAEIKKLVLQGKISPERINEAYRRIIQLKNKEWNGKGK